MEALPLFVLWILLADHKQFPAAPNQLTMITHLAHGRSYLHFAPWMKISLASGLGSSTNHAAQVLLACRRHASTACSFEQIDDVSFPPTTNI